MSGEERVARFGRHDVVRLLAIAWMALALFAWFSVCAARWDEDGALIIRDFYCFFHAGELHLAGGDPYSAHDHAFANPPFTLPLVDGLAMLGMRGAYVALAILGSLGWGVGVIAVSRLGTASEQLRATTAIAAATAPCFFLALHLGQLSGIYFAVLAGSLLLFTRGEDVPAGILGALLLAKPNFAIPLVLAALVLRRARFLLAFAATGLGLVMAGALYGWARWESWMEVTRYLAQRHDQTARDYWKQFTLYASFRALTLTLDPTGMLARWSWGAVTLGLAAWIGKTLSRLRTRLLEPLWGARVASVIALSTCALNAYLFYYDAVFLALPAATLALARGSWSSRARWSLAVACAALSWCLQLSVAVLHEGPQLAGIVSTAWLVLELIDLGQPLEISAGVPPEAADTIVSGPLG